MIQRKGKEERQVKEEEGRGPGIGNKHQKVIRAKLHIYLGKRSVRKDAVRRNPDAGSIRGKNRRDRTEVRLGIKVKGGKRNLEKTLTSHLLF